jgi:hypothetical protein
VSKLDGERRIEIAPGWLKQEKVFALTSLSETRPRFGLGGIWSDKARTNFTFLVALVAEDKRKKPNLLDGLAGDGPSRLTATEIESIGSIPKKLRFGVGGQITEYLPSDEKPKVYSGLGGMQGTMRSFNAPMDQIEKMISGSNVVVQVEGSGNVTAEGTFQDGAYYARPAFRKAFEKIADSRRFNP